MGFADKRSRVKAPWLAIALTIFGCGESDELERAAVSGRVSVDGKPLTKGHIQFIPKEGDSRGASWGQVVDGSYTIPASEGPALGPYTVTIIPADSDAGAAGASDEVPGEPSEGDAPAVVYTSKSPMEATVNPAQSNNFDFDITATKPSRRSRR
ncbi:hypothetical protein [Paludisphaera rhizosphaerae]|uniref:hypothetical protein n=1 Tax=Paludisphaera rhizosphaerae TaxID=2711216 RepID=UPI0013EA1BD0|nr:hypothetical protein [Paludisphaera rhizosphaerae]